MLAAPALIDRLMTNYWAGVSWYGNYDAASGTILEFVRIFIEASKIFIFIFASTRQPTS
jgi:hypothetical protein